MLNIKQSDLQLIEDYFDEELRCFYNHVTGLYYYQNKETEEMFFYRGGNEVSVNIIT